MESGPTDVLLNRIHRAILDQVSDVHRHLLNRRAVKGFDVLQGAFVLLRHEVDGSSLSTESTASSDPAGQKSRQTTVE